MYYFTLQCDNQLKLSGCSPLQLGSVSTPEVNSRCITLMSDGSQLVEGIMEDNIIFCYNSEATLQGSVAVAYCDEGYDRVGPERVTCGSNGSWGNLPRCLKMSIPFAGKCQLVAFFIVLNPVSEHKSVSGHNTIQGQYVFFLTIFSICSDALLVWNIFLIIIGVVTWFIAAGLDAAGLVVLLLLVREKCKLFIYKLCTFCLYVFHALLHVCVHTMQSMLTSDSGMVCLFCCCYLLHSFWSSQLHSGLP